VSGTVLALPLLEGLDPPSARATTAPPTFAIFMRQGNGVQQATSDGEPERYWPSFAPGPMTRAALAADTERALSEVADHAERLNIVRGVRFAFEGNACKHSGGGNQVLTAARISDDDCNGTLALGESLDNRITTQLGLPGEEPLTLFAGVKGGLLDEVLSYRGARQLRAAERSPFAAYQDLFGLSKIPPAELDLLKRRRKSVNDLVRTDLQRLLARADLSKADRERIDLHLSAVRDLENGLAGGLSDAELANLKQVSTNLDADDNAEVLVKLHCDVMVVAVAAGARRAATLQLGAGPDQTRYVIDGVLQPAFHEISHRADTVANPMDVHHGIDRKVLNYYKYLLDKLTAYRLTDGDLLDRGVAVFVNDVGNKFHDYDNVPYLVAGRAGGLLKTGQYLDLAGTTNNKVLNTIGAAVGCTNAAGEPLDDFGDETLEKGFVAGIWARS